MSNKHEAGRYASIKINSMYERKAGYNSFDGKYFVVVDKEINKTFGYHILVRYLKSGESYWLSANSIITTSVLVENESECK